MVAELDDFVGAATEDDVVARQAVKLGDGVTQGESAAIRIEVGVGQLVTDGLQGGRGGAERVFVGGEFGDLGRIEPVLAGHIGDGTSRLVGDEFLDVGIGAGRLQGVIKIKIKMKRSARFGLRALGHGRGLAGAETVEGAAEFGITGG